MLLLFVFSLFSSVKYYINYYYFLFRVSIFPSSLASASIIICVCVFFFVCLFVIFHYLFHLYWIWYVIEPFRVSNMRHLPFATASQQVIYFQRWPPPLQAEAPSLLLLRPLAVYVCCFFWFLFLFFARVYYPVCVCIAVSLLRGHRNPPAYLSYLRGVLWPCVFAKEHNGPWGKCTLNCRHVIFNYRWFVFHPTLIARQDHIAPNESF